MSEIREPISPPCVSDGGSQPDLLKVKQILKSLTKFVGGKKIYAENNPVLAKFSREFHDAFHDYFEDQDELVLNIEQSVIKWEDEIVYENEKREDSLAFLLYRDGIGEISFTKEVSNEELDRFVDIMKQEFHNVSNDEDIVTKLWKADFRYIAYRVLEEYLSQEFSDREGKTDGSKLSSLNFDDHVENLPSLDDKGRIIVESYDPIESIDIFLKNLAKRSSPSEDDAENESTFQDIARSILKISESEFNLCQEELRVENGSESIVAFMEAILIFTLLSHNPIVVRDVLNIISRLVDHILEERRVRTLLEARSLFRGFLEKYSVPENVASVCEEFMEKLSEDSLLLGLIEERRQGNKNVVDVLEYFSCIGKKTIPHLCQLLQLMKDKKAHQEICNTIVAIAGEDISGILDRLDIDNADTAFNTVYMMRRANLKEISPKVRELVHYPETRVKAEVINYLGELEGAEVIPLLFKALEDPEKTIRMQAMEILGEKKSSKVLNRISSIAFGKNLVQKSLDEQEAIFKTLGRLGNVETVGRIGKMIEKKHILHFGKNRENKFLAIRALENICTHSSLKMLEKLSKDSNSLVQGCARKALKNLTERLKKPV